MSCGNHYGVLCPIIGEYLLFHEELKNFFKEVQKIMLFLQNTIVCILHGFATSLSNNVSVLQVLPKNLLNEIQSIE
jgi:hypothetical protein